MTTQQCWGNFLLGVFAWFASGALAWLLEPLLWPPDDRGGLVLIPVGLLGFLIVVIEGITRIGQCVPAVVWQSLGVVGFAACGVGGAWLRWGDKLKQLRRSPVQDAPASFEHAQETLEDVRLRVAAQCEVEELLR
jgi:hypothetical protein